MHLLDKSIKILFKTSKIYTVLIFTLCIANGLIAPISTVLYQEFLDSVVTMVEKGALLKSSINLLIKMSLFSFLSFTINGIQNFMKKTFSGKLDIYITNIVLNKAVLLPMETFDNAEIYNHINRASTQTSSNCIKLLEAISESIYAFVKGLSFLYIILRFSRKLALGCIVSLFPLLHVSMKINTYWYNVLYKRVEKNRLIEYLKMLLIKNDNIKEVKIYSVGERIINTIRNNLISFSNEDIQANKNFLFKKMLVRCLDDVVSLMAKLWLLILGMQQNSSLGTIILYFNALDNLKLSYTQLINKFSDFQNSLLYMESFDVLENEKDNSNTSEAEKFDEYFNEIEFRNVSFKYPGCTNFVLKNISIKLKRGKTYFIVGLNGSGKTTLIKLFLRLYTPTEGQILIDGKDIQSICLDDYYAHISAVFQDFIKYPFNVFDNVVIKSQGIDFNSFEVALANVGMKEFVEKLPNKERTMLMRDWTGGVDLSQGQWQKLAIARCMINNNVISIFDEPFSSIDAESENLIISNLRSFGCDRLMLFITHRFSSISPTDQIIVLKEGVLIETGTHDELMRECGIYYKLHIAQEVTSNSN